MLSNPPPVVLFSGIHESGLEFIIEIPVKDTAAKENIENKIRHMIVSTFYKNKIQLANLPVELEEDNKGD